ncbi:MULTISPECIES: PaaI family thioesterase [Rhodomicrobium]|uniref:PaaI family thioesterase n=1 Tax=Rhodomicrobium TaxID=1068 RepID=UPI000B4B609E|nr:MULTISPECIES: PaaI family thioesterase [Rhodomicrobium]
MTVEPDIVKYGITPREIAAGMSGLDMLQAMIDRALPAPPIAQSCDFIMVSVERGRAVFEGAPSEKFYNPLGTVHGGWISTLLDSALGCAVHSLLEPGQIFTTTSMTINFVRPVLAATGRLRCEGVAVHTGSRLASSEARLTDAAGKLVAHGIETCMILPAPARQA